MLQGGQKGESQGGDPRGGGLCNSALTRPCLCQVDYGVIAGELEAYFNICGEVQQVTILCNKFSGHPKGYAYIEFATESSAQAAVGLDKSIFQGRVIKVLLTVFYPKQFLFRCIVLILSVWPLRGQSEPRSPSFPVDCSPEQAKVEEGWKALLDVAAMGSKQ
ncbi:Embryonic polyadenylate-binding protein 2 [Myotis davidii]|uniref:Embryonic polyadenylate-binding protein 2 n=1 Tax=Myotis davidii TaxID=225400 RepID=L5LY63_MYODS|nr:Embryonic polyadenylate-binding protein 2 [Myotis davidii]